LAAGGTAAALPLTGLAQEGTAETPATQVKQRYRETDHVKRFYALNRL
jgi:hypothetical protein